MVSQLVQSALGIAVCVWFATYFARWYEVGPDWLIRCPLPPALLALSLGSAG